MHNKVVRKNSRSRIEDMIQTLREEIASGKHPVGDCLPSESDLEKRFRLGNNSVRKGLDILVQEGLIVKIPRVGNKVLGLPSEGRQVIKLGVYNTTDNETDLSGLLEQFHRLHPQLLVQTITIPTNSYAGYIQEQMNAGLLDAVTMNYNTFRELSAGTKEELLEPMDSSPDYYPFTTEPFMDGGKLLVKPIMFSPLVLCYNLDHLREGNLPEPESGWSWDKLLWLAEQLSVENKRFGFCFHLLSRNRWPVFLFQSGIRFEPDDDGEYRLPVDRLTECLDVCRKLINRPDVFPTMLSGRDGTTVEWFLDGKVSMIMTTYFAMNRLKEAGFSFDLAPLPALRENRTMLTIIGVSVNRKSAVKDAARLLADYLGSREAQTLIRQNTFSIPSHRAAAEWQGEKMQGKRPHRFDLFREIIATFRLLEHLPVTNRELFAMQKEVELYWTGLQDGEAVSRGIGRALREANRSAKQDQ
ncbi:extracellular solute-binding protein [Paenibacillus mesophilus]|uniref:extracellular solute-binding protein n=1 Tax=Paenibacillus mesophilus TaxID=2582849 RepID=UPI00110EDFE8|nr:extracellular solute-binding protein [Paenibacillus mesophilus]TMV51619.1 extracellular solute-binding protein [Paenibacillus mesophilus]